MIKVLVTHLVFPNVHDWSLNRVQDEMLLSVITVHGNHKTTSTEAIRSCRGQIKWIASSTLEMDALLDEMIIEMLCDKHTKTSFSLMQLMLDVSFVTSQGVSGV